MGFNQIKLDLLPFKPFISLYTGHSQTMLGHFMPSPPIYLKYETTILKLDDGDELKLEYQFNNSDYTISIYHGLGGDTQSNYMKRTAQIAQNLGWNVILVNHRGIAGAKATQTYHSGRGEDACAVIRWSKKMLPSAKQVAVGFSMSGSVLLNLVTEKSGYEKPDFTVVVNAPLDLAKSAKLLGKGFSKLYDLQFYYDLKKIIKQKEPNFKLPAIGNVIVIDELYSSIVNGFKNSEHYYETCSVKNDLHKISTKTFVLSAHDDPFIDIDDYVNNQWSKSVKLTFLEQGGHMGYYSKNTVPRYGRRWLDHYLETVFKKITEL